MDRVLSRPWWKRRPFQIGATAAVIAVLGGGAFMLRPAANTVDVVATSLDTGEVVRAAYSDYVPLRAEVVPLITTYITAEAAGRVEAVVIDDGVLVTAG